MWGWVRWSRGVGIGGKSTARGQGGTGKARPGRKEKKRGGKGNQATRLTITPDRHGTRPTAADTTDKIRVRTQQLLFGPFLERGH